MSNAIQITEGVQQSWYNNHQIVAYKLTNVTPTSLNDWSDYVIAALEACSKDKPYLAIHDISQPGLGLLFSTAVRNDIFNIGIIPKANEKVQSIVKANPDWQLRLGLVLSASLSGRLARILFQKNSPDSQVQFKAFFYRDPALEWLIESSN
jgi:hypothetical protein